MCSGTKGSWKPISCVHQGVTVGQILFNIFISDLGNRAKCTFSKFVDIKPGEMVDTLDACAAIQRDCNRLVKWAGRNLLQFDKGTCKVLPP